MAQSSFMKPKVSGCGCFCILLIAEGCMATPAISGDLIIGFGADDIIDPINETAAAVVAEYRADPFYSGKVAEYSFGVAGQIDADSDFWAGVGIVAIWSLSERWFVEGSLMPGYYDMGSDGTDLGGDFQFRSLIGIGYRLNNDARLSLAIDHKSNASTNDDNPGSETVALRYAFPF